MKTGQLAITAQSAHRAIEAAIEYIQLKVPMTRRAPTVERVANEHEIDAKLVRSVVACFRKAGVQNAAGAKAAIKEDRKALLVKIVARVIAIRKKDRVKAARAKVAPRCSKSAVSGSTK